MAYADEDNNKHYNFLVRKMGFSHSAAIAQIALFSVNNDEVLENLSPRTLREVKAIVTIAATRALEILGETNH